MSCAHEWLSDNFGTHTAGWVWGEDFVCRWCACEASVTPTLIQRAVLTAPWQRQKRKRERLVSGMAVQPESMMQHDGYCSAVTSTGLWEFIPVHRMWTAGFYPKGKARKLFGMGRTPSAAILAAEPVAPGPADVPHQIEVYVARGDDRMVTKLRNLVAV